MPLGEPAGVYRLFEEHFERYVREYEERYETRVASHGWKCHVLRDDPGTAAQLGCGDGITSPSAAFTGPYGIAASRPGSMPRVDCQLPRAQSGLTR